VRQHRCNNDTGNVRDWNHVDGVDNVGTGGKLNEPFSK
jgi:hypothetical protein